MSATFNTAFQNKISAWQRFPRFFMTASPEKCWLRWRIDAKNKVEMQRKVRFHTKRSMVFNKSLFELVGIPKTLGFGLGEKFVD